MIWNPEERLSDRVRRLRDEYFAFRTRDHFRNEVKAYTTGTLWDRVFCPHNWTVVPEMFPFLAAFEDCLAACAKSVPLPDGFFELPLIDRRAYFFAEIIERQLPVQILDGELIVGGQFSTALSLSLSKSEAASYDRRENEFLDQVRELDAQGVGNCGAVPGHIIPDYPKVLRLGMRGMVAEIEKLGSNDVRRSIIRTAKAARIFAGRYAELARSLGESAKDPGRAAELEHIAKICGKVPWEPAGTFHEALQSLWFTHMLVMAAESYPGAGLSHGRIDQYLYPFYRTEIEAGRLTRDQAKELLECFWIKHNYAYDYQGRVGNNQGINSSFGQLITLGGIDADGNDASNELTWLMLEVIEEINLLEPKPNIRLHANTPPDLMRRVAALVARSQGSPFLLNFDESSMRGLAWQGLPEDQLWDYAPVGCLENTLQGCDRSGTVDVNFNMAKAVELALFNGRELESGKRIGPRTGPAVSFSGFDDFYEAFCAQLSAQLERIISVNNLADGIRARFAPTPFLSLLVGGCAEQGRDITAGGARHNYITVEGVALATTVDSLLAVKHLVYQERRVEMAELLEAIEKNFEGHEKLRLLLSNKAPRYGNDDERADELARRVSTFWTTSLVKKTSPATGRRYRGGYLSWNYWVSYAPRTAATPDGRKRGTYLSNGSCPVTGRDRLGPTANARSVARLGLESAPNGDSHTITLSPSLVRDDEHIEKLSAFLRAYAKQGGTALQVNIIDPETLRRAQREPCEYGNLLVRVTGYNAYFVTLGREIQDEIISRLCHAV
ncbi:MAG TPA: pyruvate formate lyase family protein [Myxococcota bacterium]|nr:pyruvate formate lyase family protein [Myxococcota bacterium]